MVPMQKQASNLMRRKFVGHQGDPIANAAEQAKDLLRDVLLVKKTPKYDRLKDTEMIKHPYIQDVLINNWYVKNSCP